MKFVYNQFKTECWTGMSDISEQEMQYITDQKIGNRKIKRESQAEK